MCDSFIKIRSPHHLKRYKRVTKDIILEKAMTLISQKRKHNNGQEHVRSELIPILYLYISRLSTQMHMHKQMVIYKWMLAPKYWTRVTFQQFLTYHPTTSVAHTNTPSRQATFFFLTSGPLWSNPKRHNVPHVSISDCYSNKDDQYITIFFFLNKHTMNRILNRWHKRFQIKIQLQNNLYINSFCKMHCFWCNKKQFLYQLRCSKLGKFMNYQIVLCIIPYIVTCITAS